MIGRTIIAALLLLSLASCSYAYDVRAVMIDGQLHFASDKDWFRERCVREIAIVAASREDSAEPAPADDEVRVGYGTYWRDEVSYHCENRFPVRYGGRLQGARLPSDTAGGLVAPKPLKPGVAYKGSTTTGATGYGEGQFRIETDGTVTNLKN